MKFDDLYESILNGLAKGMSVQDIADKHKVDIKDIEDQLSLGMDVEKEHTDSKEAARAISMDHLVEVPDYYTKLSKAGL